MRRLIVATDSDLKVYVAFVNSEAVQDKFQEKLERTGKTVLIWKESEIQTITEEDL